MVCKICGRNMENEKANFCEYCGASLRDSYIEVEPKSTYQDVNEINNCEPSTGDQKTISFGNWIGSLLLPFIPFIGPIIYIVMLFVWSFGTETSQTKKNWARAQLIVTIISFVLVIFLVVNAVVNALNGMSMEEFVNQYNELYKQ